MNTRSFEFEINFFDGYLCKNSTLIARVEISSNGKINDKDFSNIQKQYPKYFIEFYNTSEYDYSRVTKIQGESLNANRFAAEKIHSKYDIKINSIQYADEEKELINDVKMKDMERAKRKREAEERGETFDEPSRECTLPQNLKLSSPQAEYKENVSVDGDGQNGFNYTPFLIGGAILLIVVIISVVLIKVKKSKTNITNTPNIM
jgi:hypothetical protein